MLSIEEPKVFDLPFSQAIKYFRDKVNLPTQSWTDLWAGMHTQAFVIAGIAKNDLLTDMRNAVDKAISTGTTLETFRKDFDQIVAKHGWNYKGERGWRTAVIYNTNLSTAYHASHWKAQTDPDVLSVRPYLRYMPSSSFSKRPDHVQWYNLVLLATDPFWKTHYPPNGWGCKCGATNISQSELDRLKERETDVKTEAPPITYYEWANPKTGEVIQVPLGIDPGWDYNPGIAAWGEKISDAAMADWTTKGKDAWEVLNPGNWETYDRTKTLGSPITVKLGETAKTQNDLIEKLKGVIGGDEKIYTLQSGTFRYDMLVNAEKLGAHLPLNRSQFLSAIPETLTNPNEVWMRFERHRGTGQIRLRSQFLKAIEVPGQKAMLVATDVQEGIMTGWTTYPIRSQSTINNLRRGNLIYADDMRTVAPWPPRYPAPVDGATARPAPSLAKNISDTKKDVNALSAPAYKREVKTFDIGTFTGKKEIKFYDDVTDQFQPFLGSTKIYRSRNLNDDAQDYKDTKRIIESTISDMESKLPQKLRNTIKRVYIHDVNNPGDPIQAKKYGIPNFVSAATTSNGVVHFWEPGWIYNKWLIGQTMRHETGHILAEKLYGKALHPPEWTTFTKSEGWVSDYSRKTEFLSENFAECVKFYFGNDWNHLSRYPKKLQYLKQLFGEK